MTHATLSTLPWILKENYAAFIRDSQKTPLHLKLEYIAGIILIAPFFVIVTHNLLQLSTQHRVSRLFEMIGNAWISYAIIMPALAAVVCFSGILWYVQQKRRPQPGDPYEAGTVPSGSLGLLVLILGMSFIAML